MQIKAILKQAGKTATGIAVPEKVLAALGAGRRPAVRVTMNGFQFRTTIGSMAGVAMIPVSAERRIAASVVAGQTLTVRIELDTAPRIAEPPPDLAAALKANPKAATRFANLPPSHQREHVRAVIEAKKPETRQRRIDKSIEMLSKD